MTTTTAIQGTCDARFRAVRDAFEDNFNSHGEIGASLGVVVDGQTVVDLWGGHADPNRTRPWERDTIVNVYSTTKGITATCAHRLAEQGKLDFDAPVSKYWPEFAQAGKEEMPVRYLLSHRAGLPAMREFLPPGGHFNWKLVTETLAATEPWWEPGTQHGYHAVTYGWLVGQVIRRISGKTVSQFFNDEVAGPLGIDFLMGFGPEHDSRVAIMMPAELPDLATASENALARLMLDPTSMQFKAFFMTADALLNREAMNTREWRAAEIPAANGHTNARSLARLYGALARGGEINGVRVLQSETIERATQEQSYGEDAVLFMPTRIALGYMLDIPELQISPSGRLFGHAGMGGSFGYADPEAKVGFGYTMNRMLLPPDLIDPRWRPMFDAVYGAI